MDTIWEPSQCKDAYQYSDFMLKFRRSDIRLIFNMGIPIPGKTVFILTRGPGHYYFEGKTGRLPGSSCYDIWMLFTWVQTCIRATYPSWQQDNLRCDYARNDIGIEQPGIIIKNG